MESTVQSPTIVNRMLIRDRTQNTCLRIVHITPQQVWLCNIDDNSWPIPMPLQRLIEELATPDGNFIVELDDPWTRPRIIAPPSIQSATDILHKERYALMEPLVTGENARLILIKRERKKLIDKRIREVKCTRQHLSDLLQLWYKRGMTFEAVRPDYGNCGKTNPQDRKVVAKLGRPRTISPGIGISAAGQNRRCIQIGADYWLTHKGATLQDAADHISRLFFSTPEMNENRNIIGFKIDPNRNITARQLQYYISTNYSYSHIRRRKYGEKNWTLAERSLEGTADSDVQGPGDQFQIDATVANIYLASQFDRRRIVGRPVIYFVIDVYSSMIVGIYVGFEGPSWIGAMMALVNMVTPKVEFCRQYDIHITESDWPSHHACSRLGADRGELMSVDLGKNIEKNLRIQIENIGTGRPDLKALVERRFGIIPAKWRSFALGYVEKDFNQRGAEDYRLKATYTLYEFTQFVIRAVLEHNLSPIRGKRMPAAMITDGLTASPIDLWEWGIKYRSGGLHLLTVEEVALNVMPSAKARVTENGIRLPDGSFYTCETAVREEWFAKARREEWEVEMSFDQRRMEYAYLREPKLPRGFEVCTLMDRSTDHSGKSLFEIQELGLARKKAEAAGENKRQEKRIFADFHQEQIHKRAKKATKDARDPSASKAERTAGIRKNHAEEKEIQRAAEAFDLSSGNASIVEHDICQETPDEYESNLLMKDLNLLKQKQKKREGGKVYEENYQAV